MSCVPLRDRRILVAEDEYYLADELGSSLVSAGAVLLGPVGTLEEALAVIESGEPIEAAVLAVNLGGKSAFPAAERLMERGVPLVFTTGYDEASIPPRFRDVVRCEKPFHMASLVRALGEAVEPAHKAASGS